MGKVKSLRDKIADLIGEHYWDRDVPHALVDAIAQLVMADAELPEGHPQAPMPHGWATLAVPCGAGRDFVHGPAAAIEVCQDALARAAAERKPAMYASPSMMVAISADFRERCAERGFDDAIVRKFSVPLYKD